MDNQFSRTQLLFGKEAMDVLKEKKIAIFGIGGVGGYVVEALARSGIYNFVLIDNDVVTISNINRQIIATFDTIGQWKVDVMKKRILSINPEAKVEIQTCFYLLQNAKDFNFQNFDYVVDCLDTITAKVSLIYETKKCNVPIISAMGAGNKLNPCLLEVSDIFKTSEDPLAKVIRHELRKLNIKDLKVVYSKEKPLTLSNKYIDETSKKVIPGSNAFVPSAMGLIIASEVLKDLIKI